MMTIQEPWTELEYCDKHEYESLPCRDCLIKALETQLEAADKRIALLELTMGKDLQTLKELKALVKATKESECDKDSSK